MGHSNRCFAWKAAAGREILRGTMADDLATAREMIDAWNHGNVDRMIEFWHENGVWEDLPDVPDRSVVEGRAAIEDRLREVMELLGEMQMSIEEIEMVGDEVLIDVKFHVSGSASGIGLDSRMYHVVHFEDSLVRRYRVFSEREQAIEAARLSE
jgi:ketosteroid isomerase-like protein